MDKKNIDKRIIELIQQDENISYSKISQIVGIPEKDIEEKIKNFSDTREKILIVDDEMSTLMPLKRSLESENYAVVEAYDGHEAIKKANEEIPDLIILDLMLPGMDGFAVVGGAVSAGFGALASSSGIGAVGGIPAILVGSAAFGWGVSQMITGFLDNEIPFMGIKEAVIKNTRACDSTQDELLAINALGDMPLTGRTVPSNIGNINSVIQSSQSIYNSGSTIMNAIK